MLGRPPTPVLDRLIAKLDFPESGCWNWTGSTRKGYGQIRTRDAAGGWTVRGAHVVAYEELVGPVPGGLDLDHLCRRPACCNPLHLEAVTRGENVLRGVGPSAANARKTHCIDGHAFGDSTYPSGQRRCETCDPAGGRHVTLECTMCGDSFAARKSTAQCCSNRCRRAARLARQAA